ncbi:MAG: hypothetical protein RL143_481 [Pseudomonadota bacterium]|jgi:predicted DCC family thiol-disulfide oxidoreductase YuxK
MEKITLLYDGGCSLCSKEIQHYKRIDKSDLINWVDITSDHKALNDLGLNLTETMRFIHAVTSDGNKLIGVFAFLAVWERLSGYRWLAFFIRATGTARLLDWVYYRFANWRFKRRCKDGCAISHEISVTKQKQE